MKAKIKLAQKAVIEVSLVISIILVIGPASAFGYYKNAHQQITSFAIVNSSLTESVSQIGFADIDYDLIMGSHENPKSIKDWIEYGSQFEDNVLLFHYPLNSYEGIFNGHFLQPNN